MRPRALLRPNRPPQLANLVKTQLELASVENGQPAVNKNRRTRNPVPKSRRRGASALLRAATANPRRIGSAGSAGPTTNAPDRSAGKPSDLGLRKMRTNPCRSRLTTESLESRNRSGDARNP